jgi:hypothetical protein
VGAEKALRSRSKDEEALKNEQIKKAEIEDRRSRPRQRHLTGGLEALPFEPEDIRRVRAARPDVSERHSCWVLGIVVPACIGRAHPTHDSRLEIRREPSGSTS